MALDSVGICRPAGVGLSGDLKDPSKSIPMGTLAATIVGMLIYVAIAYKLVSSASPFDLNDNQLIMANIAIWGQSFPLVWPQQP